MDEGLVNGISAHDSALKELIVDENESSDEPEGSAGDSTEVFDRHANDQLNGNDDGDEEFNLELIVKRAAKMKKTAKKATAKKPTVAKKPKDQTIERPEDEEEFDRRHANDQIVGQGEFLSEYGISSQ